MLNYSLCVWKLKLLLDILNDRLAASTLLNCVSYEGVRGLGSVVIHDTQIVIGVPKKERIECGKDENVCDDVCKARKGERITVSEG